MKRLMDRLAASMLASLALWTLTSDARADDVDPEQVLGMHSLIRRGGAVVLAAESDVRIKLNQALLLAGDVRELTAFASAGDPKAHQALVLDLNDEIIHLDSELKTVRQAISDIPRYCRNFPNNLVEARHAQLVAYRNGLERQHNQAVFQRDTMRNRPPNPQQQKEVEDSLKRKREGYQAEVRELRKLVDSTQERYSQLARDPEVAKAIAAMGRKAGARLKLGPSRDFGNHRKAVQRLDAGLTAFKSSRP